MPLDLHVHLDGPARGPVVVLLHGFPLDARMWRAQVDPLVEAGFRVVRPDLRGHGRSARGDGPATMRAMAEDVLRALDRLDVTQFALVGFSMGGYVAFELMRHAPERVVALALVDTRAEADAPDAAKARHETAARVRAEGAAVLAEAMLPKLLGAHTQSVDPELVAEVRSVISSQDAEGMAKALEGMAAREDMRPLLDELRLPTLVLVGAEDRITPPEMARAARDAIGGASLQVIPLAGHLAPLESPSAFNTALVPWLRDAFSKSAREREHAAGRA